MNPAEELWWVFVASHFVHRSRLWASLGCGCKRFLFCSLYP